MMYTMKKTTTFNKFFIIMIPLIVVLVPLVYAASQTPQVKDKNTDTVEISQISSRSVASSYDPKKSLPEIKPTPIEKVKIGTVETIDNDSNSLMLKIGDTFLPVEYNASTTFYSGEGNKVDVSDVEDTMKIYVFGYYNSDASVMSAIKIVIANESRLQRR